MLPEELERNLPDNSRIKLKKTDWDPAIFWTNENAPSKPLLEKVRAEFESGYLIGIGSGNLLSHLPAFPNSEPKGIISIDASELVVSGLRVLREFLKLCPTRKEFSKSVRNFIAGEMPPVYPASIDLRPYFGYFVYWKGHQAKLRPYGKQKGYNPLHEPMVAVWNPDSRRLELDASLTTGPDIPGFVLQNYEIFRRLAIEGKIGVVRRDFRDKTFLRQIPNLDQYGSRNHVVYLSNAFDYGNYRWASEFSREAIRPAGGSLVYSLLGSRWDLEMYVEDKTGSIVSL